jgi:hypothetical protein
LKHVIDKSDVEFLIVPNLSVPVLFGHADIKAHKLLDHFNLSATSVLPDVYFETQNSPTSPSKAVESISQTDDGCLSNSDSEKQFFRNPNGGITVQCPMFERASILPWREKVRSHSDVEMKIVDKLVSDMVAKGQLREVAADELVLVQELILVDKFLTKGIYKPKTLPPEEGRYRIVLDCRPANALRLDTATGSWLVNTMLFGTNKVTETNETKQSQRSALSFVESIPRKQRRFFAKIDLTNAFYSVFVTKQLSKLFGFKHRDKYYTFMVLPMGWFLSPLIFHDVVTYVIRQCNLKLPGISIVHQQDDILIVGDTIEEVQVNMDALIETFQHYGFTIKKEKCEGPGDNVVFCGLKLFGDGAIKPWPVKRQLNLVAAETAAELFTKCKTVAETKHILRSWLGTANYFNKWLPPDLRSENLVLHGFLQKLETGEMSRKEVSDKASVFIKNLCTWWLNDSYGLYGGCDSSENTIIITDANVSGWTGCIFRLVERDKDSEVYPIPFSLSGLLSSHESELIPSNKSIEDYVLLPVRFDGARWGSIFETSQSSTWRERAAAMLITHRNRECLTGNAIILSDNKNLVGNWKDSESLTSLLCSAFQTYISHVHTAIHVKRNHPVIKWVDQAARNLPITALFAKRIFDNETETERSDYRKPKTLKFSVEDDDQSLYPESQDDQMSESDARSDHDEPMLDQSPYVDSNFVGHYDDSDTKVLLEREWITRRGELFFTTDKLPGKVRPESLLVPSKDAVSVLKTIHFNYGHPTAAGMRKYLHLWKLWIYNFETFAQQALSTCKSCLICRDTYHPPRSVIPMSSRPMEMVMADFLQPEKDVQPGFIIFRDRYSGFTEGRAIEKLDSLEVRQLLLEWISRFGSPAVFQTDNAEAFKAQILKDVYIKFNIVHRLVPVYDPQANGSVERTIKTIEEGLRVELASNSPPQEAIHTICGRINRTTIVPGDHSSVCPWVSIFGYEERAPFIKESKKRFDNFNHDLEIGQKVFVKIPNAPKLSPQFEKKDFFINSIEGNHVYTLIDGAGKVSKNLYRRKRLKPVPDECFHISTPDKVAGTLSCEGVCDEELK